MQPLKLLNNVQKARLLHNLMTDEMSAFVAYVKGQSEHLEENRESIAENWKDQLFGVGFWFELAEEAGKKINRYNKELLKSSTVFSEQLFDGYMAIFTIHCLTQFVATGKYNDPKFEHAVNLLFS
jgi:hypothetical protein